MVLNWTCPRCMAWQRVCWAAQDACMCTGLLHNHVPPPHSTMFTLCSHTACDPRAHVPSVLCCGSAAAQLLWHRCWCCSSSLQAGQLLARPVPSWWLQAIRLLAPAPFQGHAGPGLGLGRSHRASASVGGQSVLRGLSCQACHACFLQTDLLAMEGCEPGANTDGSLEKATRKDIAHAC